MDRKVSLEKEIRFSAASSCESKEMSLEYIESVAGC